MAIGVSLTISPSSPSAGSEVTATYTVSGNAGTGTPVTVDASVTIGGKAYPVTASLTLPGTAEAVTYAVPAADGLTFAKTGKANVFTAVVPS